MSGRTKIILITVTVLYFITGCSYRMVPEAYRFFPGKIDCSATGNWISVVLKSGSENEKPGKISGELIAFQRDTLFILNSEGLKSIVKNDVKTGKLFMFVPPKYPLIGFFSMIVNFIGAISDRENAGYFLLMGIPVAVVSIFCLIGENQSNSRVDYPEDITSIELVRYSRFPQGMPPGLNRDSLRLKLPDVR